MRNILLIENNAADAYAFRDALTHSRDGSFRVTWVRHCADALQALTKGNGQADQQSDCVAAILVNLSLPDSSGLETFKRLFAATPQIPILILTASEDDEDTAKLAVQCGAQEYLRTGRLDADLLPKTVTSMIERAANAETLFEEKERAQVTLNSIGDAVVSTDVSGQVTYLNIVAERLTGWSQQEAAGHDLEEVFRIVDGSTREGVRNPMTFAIEQDRTVALTPNCILIRRDGVEFPIEDSSAPIHDRHGRITGAVMVFHDVSAARATAQSLSHLAQHDSLTGLPNRLLLNDRLTEVMVLADRYRRRVALLFLDLVGGV